ncbi:hypothetical protein CEXT_153321 [Caerostris extrusa]|uniref:Uncharacterized protein n=1 Tax=Caerostris extrusa TaxID=172846 RepID=A0AAV4N8S1_CAEEX|nr:hypothetical protein CEXT_153321 [Caerostris extrusa]
MSLGEFTGKLSERLKALLLRMCFVRSWRCKRDLSNMPKCSMSNLCATSTEPSKQTSRRFEVDFLSSVELRNLRLYLTAAHFLL